MKRSTELRVSLGTGAATTALVYPAASSPAPSALILAHGAGAGQHHPFIVDFASAVSGLGVDVVTFNFLYTEQKRRIPDRGPALEACYRAVVECARREVASARRALFIGGKSMGGRIATQIAAADPALPVIGIVLLGYPLHPPNRFDKLRDAHLPAVGRPMLFVQGSRDPFGTPPELIPVLARLLPAPTLHVVEGGDHSFKLAGRNRAAAQATTYAGIQRTMVEWMRALTPGRADAR